MFDLYQKGMYAKIGLRTTRATDGYKFELNLPHVGSYTKSPYYTRANMWNKLPVNIQHMNKKEHLSVKLEIV